MQIQLSSALNKFAGSVPPEPACQQRVRCFRDRGGKPPSRPNGFSGGIGEFNLQFTFYNSQFAFAGVMRQ